jgi:hypothetical protein
MWGSLATLIVCLIGFLLAISQNCAAIGDGGIGCSTKWQLFLVSDPNEVGDTLAGFAGALAFIWIIVTVAVQSIELQEQRKEISTTNSHFAKQNFDNLFFELIATHNSIVGSIDIRAVNASRIIHQGRDCFRYFYKELIELTKAKRFYPSDSVDPYVEEYNTMYSKYSSDLGHYFRFVYNSLRAIEEASVSGKEHKRLFRALFSDDELLLIFYNALSERGTKMIPLIESFAFFNNLPQERLLDPRHKKLFVPASFGE